MEKILTDSAYGTASVKWDGERFAIVQTGKVEDGSFEKAVIILNPKEMLELVRFYISTREE